MLDAFERPGRFWRGNLHGHSTNSDGALAPAEVCARYAAEGYDFIALTDHFLATYDFPISDTTPYRRDGFTTILGAEVHAPKTSRDVDWHILAVGLPADFPATAAGETGPELAARCAAAGAFVAIAHPHWYNLRHADAQALDAAHAVEVYNHTCEVHAGRGYGEAMWDEVLSDRRDLSGIAVDDSHWHAPDAFGGWVMVKAEANDPDLLLAALKAGAFYASQGPQIEGIHRDGDELIIETSPALRVHLAGPVSTSGFATGNSLTQARLSLAPFAGAWCRAVVTDEAGRKAWTGPLWLD